MPIPPLDKRGLLPMGVHDCSLDDIDAAFSVRDPQQKRALLCAGLRAFIQWSGTISWVKIVYVDGSFVTDKPVPGDIDVTIELPPAVGAVVQIMLRHPVFDRATMKTRFGVDVLPTVTGQDFRDWFQLLRPEEAHRRGLKPGARKGILRLVV